MSIKKFSTFEGVFIPSLLSIFGVIMYLRLGWVVGEVGLIGAILIIILSNVISLTTGLSISSIVTNIRIGHGGAYSIITKSLGIEAGGAIGLPLYLAQAISVAFYIVGFTESWIYAFPQHDFLIVSLIVWLVVLFVSYLSARFAFRLQYGVLVIIAISFFSIFLSTTTQGNPEPLYFPKFSGDFFKAFAVFFPAVTGFMAGLSMSGELDDAKKSIPQGTLWAIFVSVVIYLVLTFWFWQRASSGALISNTSLIVDLGRWRIPILAGIMGATLSSALNMCVTAPRTLFALSQKLDISILKPFIYRNNQGEPTTAILLTSFIALITILVGTLNQVASLLTMFFLITYGLINLSVFIEQTIGIASFRPSFKVSKMISFSGAVGCVIVMFLINPLFSLISIGVIFVLYIWLMRKETKKYSPNVRSGLLIFLAEQMAKAAAKLPYYPKIWKPNLVVFVEDIKNFFSAVPLIHSIVYPSGRLTAFQVSSKEDKQKDYEKVCEVLEPFKSNGILTEAIVVENPDVSSSAVTILQTVKNTHFPPNTFLYLLGDDVSKDEQAFEIIKRASLENLGVIVLKQDPDADLDQENPAVNLWIRKGSPNIDLSILTTLQLKKSWDGFIRILQIIESNEERDSAVAYLSRLAELMRLPQDVDIQVLTGKFPEILEQAPAAQINILGMAENPDLALVRKVSDVIKTPVLFLRDSSHESAVA